MPRTQSSPIRNQPRVVERVQTGVRIEKRILKVLTALADYRDMTLGDLLEGIVLHAFEGRCAFTPETLSKIRALKNFYELDLDATASHALREEPRAARKTATKPRVGKGPQ